MDFKYIEQLLQRYFAAETTAQEEHILRTFFSQDEMPTHLRCWQRLFRSIDNLGSAHLDDQFDECILQQVGERHVRAQSITLFQRLRPLYTAAVFVAFAVVIGAAVEHTTQDADSDSSETVIATALDELDPSEATPLDIRSAEATETSALRASLDSLSTAE